MFRQSICWIELVHNEMSVANKVPRQGGRRGERQRSTCRQTLSQELRPSLFSMIQRLPVLEGCQHFEPLQRLNYKSQRAEVCGSRCLPSSSTGFQKISFLASSVFDLFTENVRDFRKKSKKISVFRLWRLSFHFKVARNFYLKISSLFLQHIKKNPKSLVQKFVKFGSSLDDFFRTFPLFNFGALQRLNGKSQLPIVNESNQRQSLGY